MNPRLLLFVVALAGEAESIGLAVRFGDFTVAGSVFRFVPLMLLAAVCFFVALAVFPENPARSPVWLMWIPCVALRIMALPMPPGDDVWRYIWEGRVQLEGHNPYLLAPSAPELASLRDVEWEKINHRDSPAIYPPLTELIFAGLARISPTVGFFKLCFIVADMLTIALLVALVKRRGDSLVESAKSVAWYAWNPAVVYAFAGAGHFDSLMLLALTTAMWMLSQGVGAPSPRRDELGAGAPLLLASTVCLGIAIALKLVPVFLMPVCAFTLGRRWWLLGISVAIPALFTLPYGGPATVMRPLLAFAEVSRFNDLVWGFIESLTRPNPFGRNWPFTLVLCIAVCAIAWRFRDDWPRAALWVFGAMLLLSPVLHPWYATWILPIAVWRRQHAWTVLSLSALSAILLWESTSLWAAWRPNVVTRAMVAVPPLLAWAIFESKVAKVPRSAR